MSFFKTKKIAFFVYFSDFLKKKKKFVEIVFIFGLFDFSDVFGFCGYFNDFLFNFFIYWFFFGGAGGF